MPAGSIGRHRPSCAGVRLDGAHGEALNEEDKARDMEVADLGYEIVSVRPGQRGYHEEVRRLVERIEFAMNAVKADPKEWAVAARVWHCTPPA